MWIPLQSSSMPSAAACSTWSCSLPFSWLKTLTYPTHKLKMLHFCRSKQIREILSTLTIWTTALSLPRDTNPYCLFYKCFMESPLSSACTERYTMLPSHPFPTLWRPWRSCSLLYTQALSLCQWMHILKLKKLSCLASTRVKACWRWSAWRHSVLSGQVVFTNG